jgi:hypothetical protein
VLVLVLVRGAGSHHLWGTFPSHLPHPLCPRSCSRCRHDRRRKHNPQINLESLKAILWWRRPLSLWRQPKPKPEPEQETMARLRLPRCPQWGRTAADPEAAALASPSPANPSPKLNAKVISASMRSLGSTGWLVGAVSPSPVPDCRCGRRPVQ